MPADVLLITWASERHLRIEVGSDISPFSHARVLAAVRAFEHANPTALGITDMVPAYASVLLAFDLRAIAQLGAGHIEHAIHRMIENEGSFGESDQGVPSHKGPLLEIPVCYAPAFALDLADVAAMHAITEREVISLHTGAEYFVHFIGFSPGFAYLGGLPAQLETPRLGKPRVRVPAGSVAIAGSQAGVYPHATPGGWRVLGRTPLRVFDARRVPASLLAMGDRVRFVEIGEEEFWRIEREQNEGPPPSSFPKTLMSPAPPGVVERQAAIRVLDPGLFTTVQDLGRPGHAALGVPESGAADPRSLRLANHLLANDENAAALELTLKGGEYEFTQSTQVCVAGADMPISIHTPDAPVRPVPLATPFLIHAGERLRLGFAPSGARAYLVVRGGVDVPFVLASRSTLVNAAMGGVEGRALRAGDVLPIRPSRGVARGSGPPQIFPQAGAPERRFQSGSYVLRIVDGAHTTRFSPEARAAFVHAQFSVASNSDRMGLRLQGPPITPPGSGRLLSEGMMWGAIQITESGQPIVLMPDHPTTGGYPVAGCVIAADLPILGQLRPNDRVTFEWVTLSEARDLWMESERARRGTIER